MRAGRAPLSLRPQQAGHRFVRLQEKLGFRAGAAALRVSIAQGRGDPAEQSAQSKASGAGRAPAAAVYEYRVRRGGGIPQNNPLNPKYGALVAIWRRLPRPVVNAIGPMLTRN